jgi:GTPase SAR1 family protein
MRCFAKNGASEQAKIKKAKQIEEELKKARRDGEAKVKLLLLGTGDSGKSTFLKQMKLLHKDGFSTREIIQFQLVLQENLLTSIQRILVNDQVNVPRKLKEHKKNVLEATSLATCVESIQILWEDNSIKSAYENRSELCIQIPSTSDYFFTHAKRIAAEDFQPTPEDIFRAKLKTTGISELTFNTEGVEITIVDVGGQRSERRKWLHCFDDVTSVIYLAALDEYNMRLEEDNETNRLDESLRLFGEMTASQFFIPASWILFLNKSDIFKDKIEKWPLSNYFDDCTASTNEQSIEYIKKKYEEQFKGSRLYVHVTCAIDTQNCKRVFTAVKDTILMNALDQAQSGVVG